MVAGAVSLSLDDDDDAVDILLPKGTGIVIGNGDEIEGKMIAAVLANVAAIIQLATQLQTADAEEQAALDTSSTAVDAVALDNVTGEPGGC